MRCLPLFIFVLNLVVVGVVISGPFGSLVQAQTTVDFPTSSPSTEQTLPAGEIAPANNNVIVDRPSLSPEVQIIRQQYRSELENYRNLERQQQVAKGQYQQLNTLVSLETAVVATKKAMVSRDKVLIHYVELLRVLMTDATGINLEDKTQTLRLLEESKQSLEDHLQKLENSNDRDGLAIRGTEFEAFNPGIIAATSQAQNHLAIGKLQTVYDRTLALQNEIKNSEASTSSELKKAERLRAIAETDRSLASAKSEIDAFITTSKKFSQFSSNSVTNIRELNKIYSSLAQSLNFVAELLRI